MKLEWRRIVSLEVHKMGVLSSRLSYSYKMSWMCKKNQLFDHAPKKKNLFEGVLYQYFVGIYYERYHRRNITISITILFVRGEREKIKPDILRVKRNFY
jgi:hypothetical protein